jgi:prepilin-type N-terminal cleavage/methylation domain-containing protein
MLLIKRVCNQKGLTLPEVLVAMTLFALLFATILPAYTHILYLVKNPRTQLGTTGLSTTTEIKWDNPANPAQSIRAQGVWTVDQGERFVTKKTISPSTSSGGCGCES